MAQKPNFGQKLKSYTKGNI